jgi:hypothetical protein
MHVNQAWIVGGSKGCTSLVMGDKKDALERRVRIIYGHMSNKADE